MKVLNEKITIVAVPRRSIDRIEISKGKVVWVSCCGNFIPLDSNGQPTYFGNIFMMSPGKIRERARRLSFKVTNRKGMVEYQLKAYASIKPGDIVLVKVGNNSVEVFRVGEYRFYSVIMPASKCVSEFITVEYDRIWYASPEQYCVEVKKIGKTKLPKELYDRIKVPRTITIFKDPNLIRRILEAIQHLINERGND